MNPVLKKTLKILGNVVLYLFMFVALFSVIVSVVSKKDGDGTATLFGYQMRFVQSQSMEKSENSTDVSMYDIQDIRMKSIIFIEVVPSDPEEAKDWYEDLEVGDVLTFKYVYTKQETITHRIVRIVPKDDGSGYMIWLNGDNKAADSSTMEQYIDTSLAETSPNYVIGKVVGQNYLLGSLIHALKKPVGLICIIIVPCVAVIVLEVLRIVSVINEEKKQKVKEEQAEKQNEIDELKKMVARLQQAQSTQGADSPTDEQTATPQTEVTSETLEEENSGGIDL